MATQTINQAKAVELLRGGQTVSDYDIHFDDDKVEALDAFYSEKTGLHYPTILYSMMMKVLILKTMQTSWPLATGLLSKN
ncbi:MAG: hypothetical protein KF852_06760 [Saprospiraceae bacterium]|nr:hypothetical protein [Saprospiraceae bacterium]